MRSCFESSTSTDRKVVTGNLQWDDPTAKTVAASQPTEDFGIFLLPATASPQAGGPLTLPAENSRADYIPVRGVC